MKILDLFSGIGGFSLGLEKAGFETAAFCEFDEHARKVLKKHWPKVPIFNDVNTLTGLEVEFTVGKIDVICGGFPCQDISLAGKQRGLINEEGSVTRSGLWFEYKRLIEELRPSYVIIENVAALRGNGLVTVLQDLWSLGYDAEWHIISARSIGSCHLRERIWIIAYPNGNRSESGVFLPTKNKEEGLRTVGTGKEWAFNTPNSDGEGCEGRISGRRKTENLGQEQNGSDVNFGASKSSHAIRARLEGSNVTGGGGGGGGANRKKKFTDLGASGLGGALNTPNADDVRLGKPLATTEEKSEWWSKATFSQRDWWKIESAICRMDDAISDGLHESERFRKQRIKQLGNSIVPGIAEIIGNAIMEYESKDFL